MVEELHKKSERMTFVTNIVKLTINKICNPKITLYHIQKSSLGIQAKSCFLSKCN